MYEKIAIEILKTYSSVVRSIAGQMNAKTPSKNNMEIFVQVGWIGILDAMIYFEPGKGEFKNFAGRKIRGQIHDFKSGRDLLSLGKKNRHALLTEAKSRCKQMKSEQCTLAEMAKETKVNLDDCGFVLSLIELCQHEELDKIMLAMNCSTVDSNRDRSLLITAIDRLDDREKIAVGLLYEKELSLQDTGQVLGISEGRVFQLLKRIIEKLRKALSTTQPPPPEDKVLQRMMRNIKCLNTLEKKILMLHHSKKVNNKDISVELGISGVRVRQIYQVAIKKLRARVQQ